jgi:peptidoglycan/LPS O-acetylase OafA/YrhL
VPLSSATRIPSLDGWRALSIAIVVLSHFEFATGFPSDLVVTWGRWFQGNLGVRIFFVISGFLITYLLLVEVGRTGRPSLKQFYARRVLRIFPVYYLLVTVLVGLTVAGLYADTWSTWLATLTFTRNIAGRGNSVTVHLWSLAVEEQFYLLWPVTLVTLALWRRHRLAMGVLLVPVVLAPIFRSGTIQMYAGAGLVSRLLGPFSAALYADSLAIGCLGAFLYTRQDSRVLQVASRPYVAAVSVAVLFALAWIQWPPAYSLWTALAPSLQALLIMAAILGTIQRRAGIGYRLLNARPVVWLGTLSYSVYIWQQLFLGHFAGRTLASLAIYDWRVWWLIALGVAVVSYYVVERPILELRSRFRVDPTSYSPVSTRTAAPRSPSESAAALRP